MNTQYPSIVISEKESSDADVLFCDVVHFFLFMQLVSFKKEKKNRFNNK
jgi:hypothetical protein